MAKNSNINLRVSETEKGKIETAAKERGLNVSQYILQAERAFAGQIFSPKIVVGLEQLYSSINEIGDVPDTVRVMIRKEINKLWSMLNL